MANSMTLIQCTALALAAFAGGLAFGVSGFAYGVVASLFLHHAFAPREVVFLVVGGGTLLNLAFLPRFWKQVNLPGAVPYIVGATFGLPIGLVLLTLLQPVWVRGFTSALILAYCFVALSRQGRAPLRLAPVNGHIADVGIGLGGGIVGGVAGLGPLLPSVWYGLRGLNKLQARGLTQPFGLFVQGAMLIWFLASGAMEPRSVLHLATAAPLTFLGAWMGARLFDSVSTAAFQRIILGLSMLGAAALLLRQLVQSLTA
ncbi:Sulfite exporter TauE/SafE [Variovorax sp. WDL1]|nr:hypothetical protein CHC07_00552 [Variovorax sp. B4]PNG61383.1 hypothetical protein CHC06_01284 [Variovorax sp. B2]VTV12614.1 Sulfite exporter TauE/SafE [Variovorax sp. WDL1]